MVSGSADTNIIVWDPSSYEIIGFIVNAHEKWVTCVQSLGPASGYFASSGSDSFIKIWETNTFKFVRRLEGHSNSIYALEILQNGLLASGGYDGLVSIWNVNTTFLLAQYAMPNYAKINNIVQLNNGRLAVAAASPTMFFVDMDNSEISKLDIGISTTSNLYGLIYSSTEDILAVGWDKYFSAIGTTTYEVKQIYEATFSPFCFEKLPKGFLLIF